MIREKKYIYLSLPIFFLLQLFLMPNRLHQTDSEAIRYEAKYFASHFEIGIPYGKESYTLPILLKDRGRYYHFNDLRKKYFNRWGLANTIIFSPPFIIQRLLSF